MSDWMKCPLADSPLWRDGKCWGRIDVVDSEDGCAIIACEGHAEMYQLVPHDGKWIEGKYISEHLSKDDDQ